jgi:5,10-methylenetetrahydromethanopterin reductase
MGGFPDSQSLAADVVVAMTLAVTATSELKVSTGVTNPVTRHPVILAGTATSLQQLSGGRVRLALGRGDAALAHLAMAPAPSRVFQAGVRAVRRLVRGEHLSFGELADFSLPSVSMIDELALKDGVESVHLQWRDTSAAPAAVDVSASGPHTIRFAARESDGVLSRGRCGPRPYALGG